MSNFYSYIAAFLAHLWPLLTAGSVFGVEEFGSRYWPWLNRQREKIEAKHRKKLITFALGFAVFYSGYLAWSDEHSAFLKLLADETGVAGSKVIVTKIERVFAANVQGDQNYKVFKISYENKGSLDAEGVFMSPAGFVSKDGQSTEKEDFASKLAMQRAKNYKIPDNSNQSPSGTTYFFDIGVYIPKNLVDDFEKNRLPILTTLVFKYRDSSTPPGLAKYTSFCAYLIENGAGGWNYCANNNRTQVLQN